MEWEKAIDILNQFQISSSNKNNEEDFDRLIDNLEILDNRLVLLNPKIRQQRNVPKKKPKTRGSNSQPRLKTKIINNRAEKKITEEAKIDIKQEETGSQHGNLIVIFCSWSRDKGNC